MKLLLLAIMILFLVVPAVAQQEDDLTQDIADLKQDIKEIEKELADARINYPDDVPEIQQELDATKNMLKAMEKMAGVSTQPKPVVTKTASPATSDYNSPIVPIALGKSVTAPLPGEDRDRLLWYRGKKINDSTLITTNAMVVQYQARKNRVVAKPDKKKDPFQEMIEELEKTEQRKDELIDKFTSMKNGPLFYPDVAQSMENYNDYTVRYNDVVKNTIDLPQSSGSVTFSISGASENQGDRSEELNRLALEVLEKLKLVRKMLDELPPVDDFPAPPEHDLSLCGDCVNSIIEKEQNADRAWINKFIGKEEEIIKLVLGVYRQLELLGMNSDAFDRENNTSMDDVLKKLADRLDRKNEILIEKYGKDIKRMEIITQTVLSIERQKAILGVEDGKNDISELSGIFFEEEILKYFNEQASAGNYNFVLNYSFFIGVERQKQLLGITDSDPGAHGLGKLYDMAVDFNRFNLSLDLNFDFKVINDNLLKDNLELQATGNIWTKDKVFVSLYREGCNWMIRLNETDYGKANESNTSIPLFVRSGTKTIRNEDDELETYQYSGNKELFAQLPSFRIDLCNDFKKDTAFMMPLNYATDMSMGSPNDMTVAIKMGDTETLSKTGKSYKEEILPIANHMFINVPEDQDILGELSTMASDIFNWITGSKTSKSSGKPKLDDMQEKHNLKVVQEKAKAEISKKAMNKESALLFDAHNGQPILVDTERDTKHRIDEYTELLKGIIHLKLVHDPIDSGQGQVQW